MCSDKSPSVSWNINPHCCLVIFKKNGNSLLLPQQPQSSPDAQRHYFPLSWQVIITWCFSIQKLKTWSNQLSYTRQSITQSVANTKTLQYCTFTEQQLAISKFVPKWTRMELAELYWSFSLQHHEDTTSYSAVS